MYSTIELAQKDKYANVQKSFTAATDYIYKNKGFTAKDLDSKPVKELTKQTFNVLKDAVNTGITYAVPDSIKQSFANDIYLFSGFKTYASLKEASALLLTDSGERKPFDQFKTDILKLDATYNQNYLQAEWQYANGTAQAASLYLHYAKDGDTYDLQYRTAGDDKVRASHAILANITLPFNDPFWDSYWTPLGWRCRCKIVQVRKGKYSVSDSAEALKLGEKATTALDKNGNNTAAIFRYNPAKQKIIFPPNHPYSKIADAAKDIIKKQADETTGKNWMPDKEITNNTQLSEVFKDYAAANTEYFARGFKSLEVTNRGVNGETDMNGRLWLNNTRMQQVKNGMNAIRVGHTTTVEQEDAFATLWHEITHNRNKVGSAGKLPTAKVMMMELANEFVARNTLPEFMESLGGKLNNAVFTENRNSSGYNTMVVNFQELITWCKADKTKVLESVTKHLFEHSYQNQIQGLVNAVKENTPYKLNSTVLKALIAKTKSYPQNWFKEKILAGSNNLLVEK